MEADFLVVGSGLAGLNFVIQTSKLFPEKKIVVVTKSNTETSNTNLAQGGIAIVQGETDSFEKHIEDTLNAGAGLCDKKIVRMVVEQAPSVLKELLELGVRFDRTKNNTFDLGREGGHSENRIVHCKDVTGSEIERGLIDSVKKLQNVTLLRHHFAIDLLMNENRCFGIKVLDETSNIQFTIHSKITFLATGGLGQVYESTTNPKVATGDGIAMAIRANAKIEDMEFIQFHPTALYETGKSERFLISEAVRGHGAFLCHIDGSKFMHKYDPKLSLACRDVVSRAVESEIKKHNINHVYLNCMECDQKDFYSQFPNIIDKCKSIGIDPSKQLIPVVLTQHYLCGGIVTNQWGETTIENLFAAGECARTGLHGANRLASNSLLEAFVFSKNSAIKASEKIHSISIIKEVDQHIHLRKLSEIEIKMIEKLRAKMKQIMSADVGVVRRDKSLNGALEKLNYLSQWTDFIYRKYQGSVELYELRNAIAVAKLITSQALDRKENCGVFFNRNLVFT